MQRETHNLVQGTDAWHQHRRGHYNASEASAMMGVSTYRTRASLIREKAMGISEDVSEAQQRLFDRGHAAEVSIRPEIERQISDELFPVTISVNVDGLPLSASLDGLTLLGDTAFECKLWNEELAMQVRAEELAPHYYWQLEQQLLVSGAEFVIFATGDGEDRLETMEYRSVPGRAEALIAGWEQFAADVAAYVPEETKPAPVAAVVEGFGALSLRIEGRVLASNLDAFKAGAEEFIARLPKPEDLQTDQDFADAESAVKACEEAESRIKAAKDAAQAQMADVDAAFRLADTLAQTIRTARLALDKVVKGEKENRRGQIVQSGVDAVIAHYALLNQSLGEYALQPPVSLRSDMGAAIKGKRTISSLRDAIDTAVVSEKISASQAAERVRANVAVLQEHADFAHLFADRVQLCATKATDDLRNLAAARIADFQQREAERLERDRVMHEEAERIERERAQQTPAAGAPVAQQPLDESANNAGVATVSRNVPPSESATHGNLPPAIPSGARVKLGDINAWIAPLSISADGLASLGFKPVGHDRAAKLYAASEVPRICEALVEVIMNAKRRAA